MARRDLTTQVHRSQMLILSIMFAAGCVGIRTGVPAPGIESHHPTSIDVRLSPNTRDVYRAALLHWATCRSGAPTASIVDSSSGRCDGASPATLLVFGVVGRDRPIDTAAAWPLLPTRASALYRSYRMANAGHAPLPSLGSIDGISIEITTKPATDERPVIGLSLPGWSASGDSALVDIFEGCGVLCGEGQGLVLRRTERGWRVAGFLWLTGA